MRSQSFDIDEAVAVLERIPASLSALLEGLPAKWLFATEGDGKWSPYDVVGHLVHGERTNWPLRTRHILSGKTAPFPAFDRTAMFVESEGVSLAELLGTFAALRRENLSELRALGLTSTQLELSGEHPEFGETTLAQLLATWVVHDLDHLAQVARTMAKVYRSEVGPWSAYLSILRDRE